MLLDECVLPLPIPITLELVEAGLTRHDGGIFHAVDPLAFTNAWNAIGAAMVDHQINQRKAYEIFVQNYGAHSLLEVPATEANALGLFVI